MKLINISLKNIFWILMFIVFAAIVSNVTCMAINADTMFNNVVLGLALTCFMILIDQIQSGKHLIKFGAI